MCLIYWLYLASGSVPLDVPASNQSMTNTKLAPSLEGDSGFCGEQSYSSVSSGPPSMCLWDSRHEHGKLSTISTSILCRYTKLSMIFSWNGFYSTI